MNDSYLDRFYLINKLVVITGAAGLLGEMHAYAVLEAKGIPVLLDVNEKRMEKLVHRLKEKYESAKIYYYIVDITNKEYIEGVLTELKSKHEKVYGLINNAANNPDMKNGNAGAGRLEEFDINVWNSDLRVGLTGAFICSQVFGTHMAENREGVIINISSDLGIVAPTQYLYEYPGLKDDQQPKKPVTYSVVKTGLVGLTKYLSTYWADKNIRANTLVLGGVFNYQDPEFISKLVRHIPLGRMAEKDEYINTIIYMLSDASSYMNGSVVSVDGGRTVW